MGENMDNILSSIKKLLGIPTEETAFDSDIIMHINSVLVRLTVSQFQTTMLYGPTSFQMDKISSLLNHTCT